MRPSHWAIGVSALTAGLLIGGGSYFLYNRSKPPAEEERWAGMRGVRTEPRFEALLTFGQPHSKPGEVRHFRPDWSKPTVAVYSSPNSRPAPTQPRLKDLSDSGQAHAIDFLSKRPASADAAWLQLTKTLDGSAGEVERRDPYRADRVLVATVAKGVLADPGDRLLWTRIFIQPINFEFAGYTVAATDNKTLKVASVENLRTSKLAIDAGLDQILPGLSKPNISQNVEHGRKTSAEVSEQYESLGIDIQPGFLRIIRESPAGGDVAGNTAIELSVVTDPTMIWQTEPLDASRDEQIRRSETLGLLVAKRT